MPKKNMNRIKVILAEPLTENSATTNSLKESVSQLGLEFEEGEKFFEGLVLIDRTDTFYRCNQ